MSILAKQTTHPTSNSELLAMIELMANPEKFKERVQHLEEIERRCDEKIALVGMADEILSLLEQSKKDRILAADTLAIAQLDSKRLVDTAREESETMRREQKKTCEEMIKMTSLEQERICEQARDELAKLHQKMEEVQVRCAEVKERLRLQEEAVMLREDILRKNEAALAERQAEATRQEFNAALAHDAANTKETQYRQLTEEVRQLVQRFSAELQRVI